MTLVIKVYTPEGKMLFAGTSEDGVIGEEVNEPRTFQGTISPPGPDGLICGDEYVSGVGQVIGRVHHPEECAGRPCVIHAPSDHSMRGFPTNWRHGGAFDIKPPHMERICPHGIGHPDPDDAEYLRSRDEDVSVHGCDGCCR